MNEPAMNWLDRAISAVSPQAGMRRMRARLVLNNYAAAVDSRLRKARKATGGPNQEIRTKAKSLRDMARAFEEDSDIAKRALDIICTNVVGTEIIPEPMVRTKQGALAVEFNRVLNKHHRKWRRRPEASHTMSHGSAQRQAVRTWVRDGEVFGQHLRGAIPRFNHASPVPYSYEMIAPDRLPHDLNTFERGTIIQGIAVNGWKEPQAYFFMPEDPADHFSARSRLSISLDQTVRKSADSILHLACKNRIGQMRGVSQFATVLSRLEDVNEIDEAERVAARIAASIGLAIFDGSVPQLPTDATDEDRETDWRPGMTLHLDQESKVEVFESDRPNDKLPAFIKRQLQHVAGGIGCGYSSLALDYSGNYSSQRQELVEVFGVYGILWAEFIDKWERPQYEIFADYAARFVPEVRQAAIEESIDLETLTECEFSRPVMPWVDPEKEIKGLQGAWDLGIDTKRRMIRSRGMVPDDVMQQHDEESTHAAKLAKKNAPPPAAVQPVEDDNQDDDDAEAAA